MGANTPFTEEISKDPQEDVVVRRRNLGHHQRIEAGAQVRKLGDPGRGRLVAMRKRV